jgi:hypothetical protein
MSVMPAVDPGVTVKTIRDCISLPATPRSPSQPGCDDMPAPRRESGELNLNVDATNGTLNGSILLPSVSLGGGGPVPRCGKLKIEEGEIAGRAMTFTTYMTVNGSRIPARWFGEVDDQGTLTLRTFDTLPCQRTSSLFSGLTGRPLQNPQQSGVSPVLTYHRGDEPAQKRNPVVGVAGKWWTIDGVRVVAADLKVSAGRISGSVSVCGDSPVKVESGAENGKEISFTTFRKGDTSKTPQVWSGNLVDEQTLRLASPIATRCGSGASTTVAFQRPAQAR